MSQVIAAGASGEFAMSLTEAERMAYVIAIGEAKGGSWNYRAMKWDEKKP